MKGPQTSRKGRLWPFSFLTGWTYGRLYSNRVLASVGACCLLILTAMTPTLALASQCADYDKAMAACVAAMADLQDNPNVSGPHCVAVNGSIHIAYTDTRDGGPGQMGDYQFICPPGLCTWRARADGRLSVYLSARVVHLRANHASNFHGAVRPDYRRRSAYG